MFDEYEVVDADRVRRCLTQIARVAARGAAAPEPDLVLQAMTHLLIVFEKPRPSLLYQNRTESMLETLDFLGSHSQAFDAAIILAYTPRATWN